MKEGQHKPFSIGEEYAEITAGCLLSDNKTLITGHQNGYVVKWNLDNPKPVIIHRTSSVVYSIIQLNDGDIYVGCKAGDLYRIFGSDLSQKDLLCEPTGAVHDRVFRIADLLDGSILTSSTYGSLSIFTKPNGTWQRTNVKGHTDAVFAISKVED